MWLTMSSSLNPSPSSLCARHSWANRSSPPSRRLAGMCERKKSSRNARAFSPFAHGVPGTGLRRIEVPARTAAMKALLTSLLLLAAELDADEGLEREVEGERLEQVVHPDRLLGRRPLGEVAADVRRHHGVVAAQRVVGERVLQDPPVVQVLVEVEQHDAAVEERTDEVRPRRTVGEGAVAVDQHLLGHVGAGGHVHPDAEHVAAGRPRRRSRAATRCGRSGGSAAAAGGRARAPGRALPSARPGASRSSASSTR